MNDELGMRNEDDERGDEEILSSELGVLSSKF
jgi:hypothetical protein